MRPIKYSDEQIFLGFYTAISQQQFCQSGLVQKKA